MTESLIGGIEYRETGDVAMIPAGQRSNEQHTRIMTRACRALLAYASRYVTPKHIWSFCPNDPGLPGYVRVFTIILASGVSPAEANFDISEAINLTRWTDADQQSNPTRFRRFRTFANAVATCITTGPHGPIDNLVPNYTVISLLDDAYSLQDTILLRMLFPVLSEIHEQFVRTGGAQEEAPFLVLAQLILTLMGHASSGNITHLAERLIVEQSRHSGRGSREFLWGCTYYDQLHERWKYFIDLSFPLETEQDSLAMLRASLLY